MILMQGENPIGNVLHVIQGPETEIWNDIHGASAVNITPILQRMDTDRPVFLSISRCSSEPDTAAVIGAMRQSGAEYPFSPPYAVFANPDERPERTEPEAKAEARGTCSRCKGTKSELVPGLEPAICYTCARIDLGLRRKDSD